MGEKKRLRARVAQLEWEAKLPWAPEQRDAALAEAIEQLGGSMTIRHQAYTDHQGAQFDVQRGAVGTDVWRVKEEAGNVARHDDGRKITSRKVRAGDLPGAWGALHCYGPDEMVTVYEYESGDHLVTKESEGA